MTPPIKKPNPSATNLMKVQNLANKIVNNKVFRDIAYSTYQLSFPMNLGIAARIYYKVDNGNVILYVAIPLSLIASGLGAYTGNEIGKYINKKGSHDQNLPSKVVRWSPGLFAGQLGLMAGIQVYANLGPHIIDNTLANRILMTLSGLFGAGLGWKFSPNEKGWASFILPKIAPEGLKNSFPEFSLAQKILKHSMLVMPSIRTINTLNFAVIFYTSSGQELNRTYDLGVYTNIIGLSLGLLNLAAFKGNKNYLGDRNKNALSYLTHSVYISIGLNFLITLIMHLVGDPEDAEKLDLGGFLYPMLVLSLILGVALPYDQHEMQSITRDEVLNEHVRIIEGQEMESLETGSRSEASTDSSDISYDINSDQSTPPREKHSYGSRGTVFIEEVPIDTPVGVQKILSVSNNRNLLFNANLKSTIKNGDATLSQPLLDPEATPEEPGVNFH
ncbi:Uncharacterised protein (plasmid) [Legionella adelaidensis]|uniref:Transmembrane protein n=1 Tax=Legionella adelaidensis TaxID=45056 RepID=A0A0W0R569_9GAMM|nr:hypothetical protein [Legionella adelaidensis]KTC66174.1 hypothetical protein Lade_0832 [Legionella adelaidensis]VEH85583.1 Uncharacterised protein [Legionella adelaidensis]